MTSPSNTAPPRVLIVDDQLALLTMLARALRDAGYQVLTASDSDEALRAASASAIDIVVSDVSLPSLPGSELVSELRALWPAVRVLYISGVAEPLQVGDEEFLTKPLRVEDLIARVHHLTRARRTGSES